MTEKPKPLIEKVETYIISTAPDKQPMQIQSFTSEMGVRYFGSGNEVILVHNPATKADQRIPVNAQFEIPGAGTVEEAFALRDKVWDRIKSDIRAQALRAMGGGIQIPTMYDIKRLGR